MDDIVSILFRRIVFYKFDLPKLNQCIDTMVSETMIPICMGYSLPIPTMYMIMNMYQILEKIKINFVMNILTELDIWTLKGRLKNLY